MTEAPAPCRPRQLALHLVREQYVNQIPLLGCLVQGNRLKTMTDRKIVIGAAGPLADYDVAAAVTEILCLGVSLRTVSEDRNGFVFEPSEIGFGVVVDLCWHNRMFSLHKLAN